ncbi:unnamed protein product [Phaeothamnion confervicola]
MSSEVKCQAIVVEKTGGPEVLQLKDVTLPAPWEGTLLVKLHAAGVNPVDTYIRGALEGYAPPVLPYTPGIDGAGVVEAVGPGVKRLAVGDRVYVTGTFTGTYATKAICAEDRVQKLPENVSFAEGASLGIPMGTAYRAIVQKGHGRPGEKVLIHGASGQVGLSAVKMASDMGMAVFGTVGSSEGETLVRKAGAEKIYNHEAAGYAEEMTRDHPGGFDMILEMLANVNLQRDLELLAKGGRVIVIGSRDDVTITPRLLMAKEASIIGILLLYVTPPEWVEIHAAITAGLKERRLVPVVDKELPLSEASKAHRDIINRPGGAKGNIVLVT